jgi:hypothetical protein
LIAVREELRLANNDLKVLYEFNKGTYPSGYTPVDTSSMTGGAISAYNSETDEIEFILDGDRKQ